MVRQGPAPIRQDAGNTIDGLSGTISFPRGADLDAGFLPAGRIPVSIGA